MDVPFMNFMLLPFIFYKSYLQFQLHVSYAVQNYIIGYLYLAFFFNLSSKPLNSET